MKRGAAPAGSELMAIGIGLAPSMRIFACCAALALALELAMAGHARAQDDRQARADDRTAVAECLKLAVAAVKRRNDSQAKADDASVVQQEKIDPAAWVAALAAKHVEIDRSSCIGVVSSPCQAVPENSSTIGLAECSRRELAVWDERLNAAYKAWIGNCDSKPSLRSAPQTGEGMDRLSACDVRAAEDRDRRHDRDHRRQRVRARRDLAPNDLARGADGRI